MYTITHAINYWSKVVIQFLLQPSKFLVSLQGAAQAMFLRHEGYLGAIGAFMKGVHERGIQFSSIMIDCVNNSFTDAEKFSWAENKALSSGLQSPVPHLEPLFDEHQKNMTVRNLEPNACA
jgi:hypothetical protein